VFLECLALNDLPGFYSGSISRPSRTVLGICTKRSGFSALTFFLFASTLGTGVSSASDSSYSCILVCTAKQCHKLDQLRSWTYFHRCAHALLDLVLFLLIRDYLLAESFFSLKLVVLQHVLVNLILSLRDSVRSELALKFFVFSSFLHSSQSLLATVLLRSDERVSPVIAADSTRRGSFMPAIWTTAVFN
jgi:hypothetical protein